MPGLCRNCLFDNSGCGYSSCLSRLTPPIEAVPKVLVYCHVERSETSQWSNTIEIPLPTAVGIGMTVGLGSFWTASDAKQAGVHSLGRRGPPGWGRRLIFHVHNQHQALPFVRVYQIGAPAYLINVIFFILTKTSPVLTPSEFIGSATRR